MAVRHPQNVDSARLRVRRAINLLDHRGPDARGDCVRNGVVLAHSRLSVLDLSNAGSQPMVSPDGRFAIAYNGECYNFRDIARELRLGSLRSTSDTEVVLAAFCELRAACLPRLNGMFAFAVHDRDERELWLVRDRLGIKPLYVFLSDSEICFASEIGPLLAMVGSTPTCDARLLHEWLYFGNVLGGKTLFNGISQVPPGHLLRLRMDGWTSEVQEYWSLARQFAAEPPAERGRSLATAVHDRLEVAVSRQLASDVPVGVFLSGGVDSSAIATFAAKSLGSDLRTFCAGFDDPSFPDERPRARWLANRLGTTHEDFLIRGDGVVSVVGDLISHHGMPFFDAANVPLWLMAKEVRSRVSVVLQGDGGDELFGGYRRYRTLRWRGLIRALSVLARPATCLVPQTRFAQRVVRYMHAFGRDDLGETICLLLTSDGADSRLLDVFEGEIRRKVMSADPFAHIRSTIAGFPRLDACRLMSAVDLMVTLPDLYLEKVDRSTMAHGLEVRVPFLDHDLVDFVVRVPSNFLMPGGRAKWLLKESLRPSVPSEILDAPKRGFNVPFGRWLRGPLRADFADQLSALGRACPGLIDRDVVDSWIALDATGRVDLSSRLWKLYNLAMWANRFKVQFA